MTLLALVSIVATPAPTTMSAVLSRLPAKPPANCSVPLLMNVIKTAARAEGRPKAASELMLKVPPGDVALPICVPPL